MTQSADTPQGSLQAASALGFGLDLLQIDERLRLFTFVTTSERFRYLAILRVFDQARHRYAVRLRPEEIAAELAEAEPTPGESSLHDALDRLTEWKILDRSHDASRVASISEYRRRRSVYQFTELGFLAFDAVQRVLRATPSETELRRLAFPSILTDLQSLAEANVLADANKVYVLLDRLHETLKQIADRAARFYIMLGELNRTQEARPDVFLRHKDVLLSHLTEFLGDLQRYRPALAAAVRGVSETGEERMIAYAASADRSPFTTQDERLARCRDHWSGIVGWFVGSTETPSHAEHLDRQTATAISQLVSLLRRITESRRGGISHEAQLRFLARWFVGLQPADAHALFAATFGLRSVRHLSVAEVDPDLIGSARSWWKAPPVEVSTTLREHGREPSPGRPGALPDTSRQRAAALAQLQARRSEEAAAEDGLVRLGLQGRVLTRGELDALLRLLDLALQSRASVVGRLKGAQETLADATSLRVRVRLLRSDRSTIVRTTEGRLELRGVALDLLPLSGNAPKPRRSSP
ncbi:MAG: TIGR02677 family protein [Planctomycetes bacterium]|nr:TIGR02677 family protein [Planctomycetota bacterium]